MLAFLKWKSYKKDREGADEVNQPIPFFTEIRSKSVIYLLPRNGGKLQSDFQSPPGSQPSVTLVLLKIGLAS